jgi:hypothetical protein
MDHVKRSRTESSKFELSRDEAAFAGGSSRGGKRGLRGRNPMNDASDDDEDEDGDDMAKRIRKAARMIQNPHCISPSLLVGPFTPVPCRITVNLLAPAIELLILVEIHDCQ